MEELKKCLIDLYPFKLTTTGTLRNQDNTKLRIKEIIQEINSFNTVSKYNLQNFHAKTKNIELDVQKALDEIRNDMLYSQEVKATEGVATEFLPDNVILGIDAYKDAQHILNKELEPQPVLVESWKKFFGLKIFSELDKVFCTMTYNPYSLDKVLGSDGLVKCINTCIHPDWRYQDQKEKKELHPLFLKYIRDLFKNEESFRYTMSWYKNAIFNRNETALVMVGAKAVGKNIFCSTFNRMVGPMNVSNQANNAYQEKFNGFLKNTRVVVADEVSFKSSSEKNRVKKYFNTIQSIETKGKDSETIEVFCSMVMLSNDVHDLFIESDDRRFSCVDLTDVPLPKRMTPKEISELRQYIDYDPDFPLAFYQFIEAYQYKDFVNALPYKGEIFSKLVYSSMSEFNLAIIDKIVKKECTQGFELGELDIDWEEFDKKRHKPRFDTLSQFLDTFTYKGEKLGTIVKSNRFKKYYVEVNPKFRATGFKSEL